MGCKILIHSVVDGIDPVYENKFFFELNFFLENSYFLGHPVYLILEDILQFEKYIRMIFFFFQSICIGIKFLLTNIRLGANGSGNNTNFSSENSFCFLTHSLPT